MSLRQPIVSVMGHVDHGKTSLLDFITTSKKAAREAGGITQQIQAIEVSASNLEKLCKGLIKPGQLTVPGLLFIDTPGHRAFISMRRRGGSLADVAVLVVAINEGFMPQTREVLQILRHEKTPFVVAVNKLDLVPGYRPLPKGQPLANALASLPPDSQKYVDERIYAIAEELYKLGFSADRFDKVIDYAHNIALVPVSAKTGAGVPDLLALIIGLSQKFLAGELKAHEVHGEATILECSEEKGLGSIVNAILYNGTMSAGDTIAVTGQEGPFLSKIRALYRHRRPGSGTLQETQTAKAAAGLVVSAPGMERALPGGILRVVPEGVDPERVREELGLETNPARSVTENGVWLKSDTLGSLDALFFECQEARIAVKGLEVGSVTKREVTIMSAVRDPSCRAILVFNNAITPEASMAAGSSGVQIFSDEVIFRLIDKYREWREVVKLQTDRERRKEIPHPAKVQVLPGHVYRSSKPAIVGIRVLTGIVRPQTRLVSASGAEVGLLKGIQESNHSVPEAVEGAEVAAAIDGAVVGRTLAEGDILYVSLSESTVRELKAIELTNSEKKVLEEYISIQKTKTGNRFWGL